MNAIEVGVLEACQEVALRQREMLPQLAAALEVPEDQVFYTWAFRKCRQHGSLDGGDWNYFFHGLECDLNNTADGRHLRIDFGPGGSVETFTAWGVLQFIMTSVAPWREFPQLQARFAKGPGPFDQFSGAMEKMSPVWDRLEAMGAFEKADPSLLELEAKSTKLGPDGLRHLQFPPEISETTQIDCSVAGRQRLSLCGTRLLETHLTASLRD
jgi:hypothetical protein